MTTEEGPTSDREKNKDKDKDKHAFDADPPIIVGGGGSTLVWMKKSTNPTEIDPATVANAPSAPKHPDQYRVFECKTLRITKNLVKKDKNDNGTPHDGFDPDTHRTDFE